MGISGRRAFRGRRKAHPGAGTDDPRGARQGRRLPGHRRRCGTGTRYRAILLQAARAGWRSEGCRQWRAGKHALLPRLRQAHRPAPARPAQKILQRRLPPHVVGETPRGTSSRRCGDLFQDLRLLRKDISGVWKRPSPVLLARLLYFRPLPQGRDGRAYSYQTVILTFGLI